MYIFFFDFRKIEWKCFLKNYLAEKKQLNTVNINKVNIHNTRVLTTKKYKMQVQILAKYLKLWDKVLKMWYR